MNGKRSKTTANASSEVDAVPVICDFDSHSVRFVITPVGEASNAAHSHPDEDAKTQTQGLASELGRFRHAGKCYAIQVDNGQRSSADESPADLTTILTARELQIASLISLGFLNKQIAGRLEISEHTVSSYLNRIFSKLRLRTRAAVAARYAAWTSSHRAPDQ